MLSETIKHRLTERFAVPFPEFHKRRIVFWHDEDGEFAEEVNELALPNVTLVKLTLLFTPHTLNPCGSNVRKAG